jgi:pimeloyl-ACP methyl ester carboxylesterase
MGRLLIGILVLVGLAAVMATGGYFMLKRDDIPYAALATKYETPASRYIDLPGGVHMHYEDQGAQGAPTLFLLHGFSASLHTWEPWVGQLGDAYRLVSIDLPGHGLTRAPAGYQASIESLRDAAHDFAHTYGLTRYTIVGNSMGGNVAWEYALAYPDEVEALVLVDASGWPEAHTAKEPAIFGLLRNPTIGPIILQLDNTKLIRQGLEDAFVNKALVDDDMVSRYAELSRAPGHRDILLQLTIGFDHRNFATAERLAALQAPTLVMTGDSDALVAPEEAQQFRDSIPNAQIITFDGVGHLPQEEAPDKSAAALRRFLQQVEAAHPAAAVAAQ